MDHLTIRWTQPALDDIQHVYDYISADRPDAASCVIGKIRAAVEPLRRFPESGRVGRARQTRELVIHGFPFVVAYRVRDGEVEILSVIHTSRRWPERFDLRR